MKKINYYRDYNLPVFEIKNCDSGVHSSKNHYHEELSIGIIEKGSSIVNCGGKNYNINSKTAVIIYPNVIHRCNPESINSWKFSMLYLKKDWIKSTFPTRVKTTGIEVKRLIHSDINRMRDLFRLLQSNNPSIEKEERLIVDIDYLFRMNDAWSENFYSEYIKIKTIQIVKDYIDNNFLEKITLGDLEKCIGLSKYHIIRLFKEHFNTTPHSYQTLLRLNYSKKLLKSTDNISDIAQETGFYDQSHFNKSFKDYFGVTPLDYKMI